MENENYLPKLDGSMTQEHLEKLGRRSKMNLSLNVELVKNEGMKGSNFFPQGIRRYGERFKMTSSNDT